MWVSDFLFIVVKFDNMYYYIYMNCIVYIEVLFYFKLLLLVYVKESII